MFFYLTLRWIPAIDDPDLFRHWSFPGHRSVLASVFGPNFFVQFVRL